MTEKAMEKDLEQRVINLESIMSFQDQTIEDLNQVVISQQNQIDKLTNELQLLHQSLINLQEEPNNKPPPHY